MYLIDTVVLSEFRKGKPHPAVLDWLRDKSEDDLFLSVITIGEIERGIDRQRSANPGFAEVLSVWLDGTLATYSDRILPVTVAIGRRWGRLSANLGYGGADLLIAATAIEHGLTVVTRNLRHFVPTGVPVQDPFVGTA
jgi:toxin FitB